MTYPPEEQASAADLEFAEWAKTMRTTPELLREATESVGIAPRKIRTYLIARDQDQARQREGIQAK